MKIVQGGIASGGNSRGEILIKVTSAINDGSSHLRALKFSSIRREFSPRILGEHQSGNNQILERVPVTTQGIYPPTYTKTKQPQPTSRPIILLQSGLYQRLCKFQARTNFKM